MLHCRQYYSCLGRNRSFLNVCLQQSGHFQLIPIEAKVHLHMVNCDIDNGSEKAWEAAKSIEKLRNAQLYANVK